MAEEELNYASVVFKTKKQPQPEVQKEEEEETVYDEVKVPHKTPEQAADLNVQKEEETVYDEVKKPEQAADLNVSAGFLPDKKATNRRHHFQLLACCLGTFCVILLLGIIAVSVFFSMDYVHVRQLNELKKNQTTLQMINHNLTVDNNKLRSENENLRRDNNNLTVITGNLTQKYNVSESKVTNLTEEINKLNKRNQELETQNNNLTEEIRKWSENSIAQVQQNIDDYCPKKDNKRQCNACESGWLHNQSSCYLIKNTEPAEQKTWEEARDDCRGKLSDLAVIVNEVEKRFISENSWSSSGIKGYWIGLRVEDGRWKWIVGSDLTESSWIQQQPPINGHCAISVKDKGWKSATCGEKNAWICKKKALSV